MATSTQLGRQLAVLFRRERGEIESRLLSRELACDERERELSIREAELAAAMEQFTAARLDSGIWAEATATERQRWLALVDDQLQWFRPDRTVGTVLRTLRKAGAA